MSEYIDRELAEKIFWEEQQELLKWKRYHQFDKDEKAVYDRLEDYQDKIKALPTADVVEVVRCKDCKYYKQNPYSPDEDMMCMCWCDWLPTDPDDFCSYGERKE